MLLVEMSINAVLKRLSMEGLALDHWWANMITSFTPPQYSLPKDYGGYARLDFGSIILSPDLFKGDWPPPASCPITVKYTATDEASAETLFSGTAHRAGFDRDSISYDLHGTAYDTVVATNQAFDDTLANVMAWAADPTRLNLTLDTTAARAPSPALIHTMTSDRLLIDTISDFCAFFSHCFHIEAGTLYLVDMLADNGSEVLTEYDYFPSTYEDVVPTSIITGGDYSRASAYPYGEALSLSEAYHSAQANIEAALDDILSVINRPRCRLRVPLLGGLPAPGKKVSWTDSSLVVDTAAYIRARRISYDFENEVVEIEGEGEITAA
ncbi:MAG: hypothetical protein OEY01_10670 [Desulfobulbaceae bacterium]|nr:hypothetical protein [Desulfobulbaceae bacterium]